MNMACCAKKDAKAKPAAKEEDKKTESKCCGSKKK
jgi:hypothetical protein